jgi:hypothetical protein
MKCAAQRKMHGSVSDLLSSFFLLPVRHMELLLALHAVVVSLQLLLVMDKSVMIVVVSGALAATHFSYL